MSKFIEESWLVLLLGVIFAGLLAGTQTALAPRIELNKNAALEAAALAVVPGAVRTERSELDGRPIFKCYDEGGQQLGWAIKAEGFGFQDKIHLVFGVTLARDRITGLKVIENVETPGLGNRIEEAEWAAQYQGLAPDREVSVVKQVRDADKNQIQAITGATISSEAVTKIVNDACAQVLPRLEQVEGQ